MKDEQLKYDYYDGEETSEDLELVENSYTADFDDEDPAGSFCDMPEDELEEYKNAKNQKEAF